MKKFILIIVLILFVLIFVSCLEEKSKDTKYISEGYVVKIIERDSGNVANIVGQNSTESAVKIPNYVNKLTSTSKLASDKDGLYKVVSVENLSAETIDISSLESDVKLNLPNKEILLCGLKFKVSDDNSCVFYQGISSEKHIKSVPSQINGEYNVVITNSYKKSFWKNYDEKDNNKLLEKIDKELEMTQQFQKWQSELSEMKKEIIESKTDSAEFISDKDYNYDWKSNEKWIEISLSDQVLIMHDNHLKRYFRVSTGKPGNKTPTGEFPVIARFEMKDYYGYDKNKDGKPDYYQPDVPWSTKFAEGGYYIHGCYWHNNFGNVMSHGCINMKPDDAKIIYDFLFNVPINNEKVIVIHE